MGGTIPSGNFIGFFWGGFTDGGGGGVWWVEISRVGVFQGRISIEPWNICKKGVNTFVFVSRGVAL